MELGTGDDSAGVNLDIIGNEARIGLHDSGHVDVMLGRGTREVGHEVITNLETGVSEITGGKGNGFQGMATFDSGENFLIKGLDTELNFGDSKRTKENDFFWCDPVRTGLDGETDDTVPGGEILAVGCFDTV